MVTLRLLLDRLHDPRPSGTRRYTVSLAREIVRRAPGGCDAEALLAKTTPEAVAGVRDLVPGLVGSTQSSKRLESLEKAWPRGFATATFGGGLVHAFEPLAPLRDISLSGGIDQTVVTWHHAAAFTRPELLDPAEVKLHEALLKRAHRFASAIVVPTNAVADELGERYDFGGRLRVIGGAASATLRLPEDETTGDEIARTLGLPDDYVATFASLAPRRGLEPLLQALALPAARDARLVVIGSPDDGARTLDAALASAGVGRERVTVVEGLRDEELAVVLQRANALVVPSLEAGFGLPLVEAFRFGTPVIASDAPALVEVAMDAALLVERSDEAGYPERLAGAIASVLGDRDVERRLRLSGKDRGAMFNWSFSADQVWQLHADL